MKSLYYSRATSSEPTIPAGETSEGFPTNGSPTGGQKSTVIGAYWYHMVTMEIVNAISAAGIKPDAADLSQLDQAITKRLEALRLGLEKSIGDVAQSLAQQGIPTGAIMPFDSEVEPNEFWLICDGRAVSRSTYAKLFRHRHEAWCRQWSNDFQSAGSARSCALGGDVWYWSVS